MIIIVVSYTDACNDVSVTVQLLSLTMSDDGDV